MGAIDFATQTAKGLRNTATLFDEKVQRKRLPRYVPPDGSLQPYNDEVAKGQNLMMTLHKGKYQNEKFLYHKYINEGKGGRLLLVSNVHILYRKADNLAKLWKVSFSGNSPNQHLLKFLTTSFFFFIKIWLRSVLKEKIRFV